MADRRDLQKELNRINELYRQKDLELNKIGGSTQDRQKLLDMLNNKKQRLIDEMGDPLHKLNAGGDIHLSGGTISKGLDQSHLPDIAKQVNLGKEGVFRKTLGTLGKKAAGVIPLAGAGLAALSGDPAMAAEELAGDIPVLGQAYEAIKPTESGNPEEERQMLAERGSLEKYKQSPAALDKLQKLKELMGKK